MPTLSEKRTLRYFMYGLVVVTMLFLGLLTTYNLAFGIAGFVVTGLFVVLFARAERKAKREMESYIQTLSYRVKRVSEEALTEMPIGILLYNEELVIEWANPFMVSSLDVDSLVGRSLYDVMEQIVPLIKMDGDEEIITLYDRKMKVTFKRSEKLLYFVDVTEQVEMERMYENERTVIAIIFLDNYDEITQNMDDQKRSSLNNNVTSLLNRWATDTGVFLKRVSSDRYLAVMNENILSALEKGKFAVLDEIREQTAKGDGQITLSVGIGVGTQSLLELGQLAQSSLDLALGRGGDQVAIKQTNGKVKFYGGKTNPIEKRTRVRARVISHALRDLIVGSDQVFIMGHKYPDMDALGAAIGILRCTHLNDKPGFVVLDVNEIDVGVQRLMAEVRNVPELWERFISPADAMHLATEQSLLVIVDTHRPSLVIEEKLLDQIDNVIVIDHHRRGEDFIEDPLLVYMEPYASSTAELVTELLEYQPQRTKMTMLEATALLAGIMVDTKNFTLRTGSRTFDAASYLRTHGADTVLVQRFLKEGIDQYMQRSHLIEDTHIDGRGVAIAIGKETETFTQVLIAQAADTLLTFSGVIASFVVARRAEEVVSISARSLGDVNVQVIMEKLAGGGHLTNAATQLSGLSIREATVKLQRAIDDYFEGGKKE